MNIIRVYNIFANLNDTEEAFPNGNIFQSLKFSKKTLNKQRYSCILY